MPTNIIQYKVGMGNLHNWFYLNMQIFALYN